MSSDCVAIKDFCRPESCKFPYALTPVNKTAAWSHSSVLKSSLAPNPQVLCLCLFSGHSVTVVQDFYHATPGPGLAKGNRNPDVAGVCIPCVGDKLCYCRSSARIQLGHPAAQRARRQKRSFRGSSAIALFLSATWRLVVCYFGIPAVAASRGAHRPGLGRRPVCYPYL